MSNQPNQNQNRERDLRPQQGAAAPSAAWKPDEDTYILIPDEPAYLRAAQDAVRTRFGAHKGHAESMIDATWLHGKSTILVLPLRDKVPGEDPRPYKDPATNQIIDSRKFEGFLECEPVRCDQIWKTGRHVRDGAVKLKGPGGLLELLNDAVLEGKRRMPDGTLEPAVAQGRVTLRLDKHQTTLQLSAT